MNIFRITDSSQTASAARRAALTRRAFLMTGLALPVPLAPALAQAAPPKPNVLFIAVDDLNIDIDIGTYGHKVVKTPNIDRLASWGVRFDRAFCQLPWCNPSRASLLSGLRPDTTRIFDLPTPATTHLPGAIFLPQHFKSNGYFSARVGKIFYGANHPAMKQVSDSPASWDVS